MRFTGKKLVGRWVLSTPESRKQDHAAQCRRFRTLVSPACVAARFHPAHATTGCIPIASGIRCTRQVTLAVVSRRSLLVGDRLEAANHTGTPEDAADLSVVRAAKAALHAVHGAAAGEAVVFHCRIPPAHISVACAGLAHHSGEAEVHFRGKKTHSEIRISLEMVAGIG